VGPPPRRDSHVEAGVTLTDRSLTALTVAEMLRDHDAKLESLLEWRSELRGAMALVKLATGASFLSATVSIIAVVSFLAGRN
jgi:hypothetical protein